MKYWARNSSSDESSQSVSNKSEGCSVRRADPKKDQRFLIDTAKLDSIQAGYKEMQPTCRTVTGIHQNVHDC